MTTIYFPTDPQMIELEALTLTAYVVEREGITDHESIKDIHTVIVDMLWRMARR
jgi:hypothetical protein